jgi:FkbM family methyltransferase
MNIKDKPYIQLIHGRYGPCYVFTTDEYLSKSVINYGEYNKDECEHIVTLANEKKGLVLDIGANIGNISQALISAGHEVIAFEPQPEVFELLKLNCPSATVHNVALGATSAIMQIPKIDYSKKGNFGGVSMGSGMGLVVEIRTLDSYNFHNVSLIKIDVEGFEEQVLLGARETIAASKPIIYLEADRVEKLAVLDDILQEMGYSHVSHNPPLFNPDNLFKNVNNVWDKNYASMNWECRPI